MTENPCRQDSDRASHDNSPAADLKQTFMAYFNEGMNPAAAMKFNKDCLEMAVDFTEQHLARIHYLVPSIGGMISGGWKILVSIYIYMLHVHYITLCLSIIHRVPSKNMPLYFST